LKRRSRRRSGEKAANFTGNGAFPNEISEVKGPAAVKPINPWPMIAMLLLVIFLYLWLNGYLT